MKRENLFWGIIFILGAILLIWNRIDGPNDIGFMSILTVIICIAIIIRSVPRLNFWGILLPLAFLAIVFDEQLGITDLTPAPVLGAAVLASIGLSMIFKGNKFTSMRGHYSDQVTCGSEKVEGGVIRFENCFGSVSKYITSDDFQSLKIENSFGSMNVYFDNAIIQHGIATVKMDNSFGTTVLYVPASWKVDCRLETAFGSVKEVGLRASNGTPVLQINGDTSFGSVVIQYI